MRGVICSQCGHENEPGVRICANCYARLSETARSQAEMGLRERLKSIPVGKLLPLIPVVILLVVLLLLSPELEEYRQLLILFGLLGLVALGVTFPLAKGEYDFSAGPIAGVAACVAILATGHEQVLMMPVALTAVLIGVVVGFLVGLINGLVVGWTRIPSSVFTIIMALVLTEVIHTLTIRHELVIQDAAFRELGEATLLGIPAALVLLVLAAVVSIFLWRSEAFRPLASVFTRRGRLRLSHPMNVLWSFGLSGVLGGLAGVFIAASGLPLTSPMGSVTWILAPMTAAILGGGVIAAGMGSTWTALSGAAALSLITFLLRRFQVPIAGPIAEGIIFFVLLLGGRLLSLNWYEIQELRRRNLLAIPGAQRLPQVLFRSKYAPAIWAGFAALLTIGAYAYVSYYVVKYVPPNAAIVASVEGRVDIHRFDTVYQEWQTQTVEPDMLIRQGQTLQAYDGASCLLRMSDGSIVEVAENSRMSVATINEEKDGTRTVSLKVTIGRLFATVKKMVTPESRFEVDTPMLTVAVRGTTFEVNVEEEHAIIGVLEGALSMSRFFTATDEYGQSTIRPEGGKILGGHGVTAYAERPLESPYTLPAFQENRMRMFASETAAELGGAFTGAEFLKGIAAALIIGIAVYLSFLYLSVQPSRIVTEEEVREAARRLEQTRTQGPEDSSRSAAIVQMLMEVGRKDEAREELERMVGTDPQSPYGSWAQRMLSRFRQDRPTEDEDAEQTGDYEV